MNGKVLVLTGVGILSMLVTVLAQIRSDSSNSQLDALKDQYARAIEKANTEHLATLVDLRKKFVAALDTLMQTMTRQGDLDGALAVRTEKNKEPTTEPVVEKEAPRTPRQSMKANCFVAVDDQFIMCVNGVEVGRSQEAGSTAFHLSLAAGDVITVKVVDIGAPYGFGCVIRREGQKDTATNVRDWRSYQPKDKDKWWIVDEGTITQPPSMGTNGSIGNKVELLCGVGCQNIWGAPNSAVAYFMFKVK